MIRQLLPILTALATAVPASMASTKPGDEVVVVYNRRMPESKRVAEHYASRREVPKSQVIGLDLPTSETLTRTEFREALQMPLKKALEDKKLFRYGSNVIPATDTEPARVEWVTKEAKVRYLVLCYGVPVRILHDPSVHETASELLRPELRKNGAAVDSELAWLPIYEQTPPITGPLNNPYYTSTNAASFHPTNGLLMVARLDGPSETVARGLVDKALQAEKSGLWGRAYFDLRSLPNGDYKLGEDWIGGAAEMARVLGFETVVDRAGSTFPSGFPMSHIAFYAGWYDPNVSGPFSRPVVEFMPGAFAYHLHSYSAGSVRSPARHWVGPLLQKGATATMGSVDEPYLQGTPDIAVFFGRLVYFGFTFGEAAWAAQGQLSWQTTIIGDPLYRPFGRNAHALHNELESGDHTLAEWSHLRVVNLNLAQGNRAAEMVAYLESLPRTGKSAVLLEKLGDLYFAQGKPSSSAHAYNRAVNLDPSPQQRVRLYSLIGERHLSLNEPAEALLAYDRLLAVTPDHPDKLEFLNKLLSLARQLDRKEDSARYEEEIRRLTGSPASGQ